MTEQEVREKTLEYFDGNELITNVWMSKYALKNKQGEFLESSPTDMHWRLTKELYRIESKYSNPMNEQEIFNLLDKFKYFIPAGSPMYGIGNKHSTVSLSNCYTIGKIQADSYGAIHKADEEIVQLSKRRGGSSLDISTLRPKNTIVNNAAGTSTGAVSFMDRFSHSIRETAQLGRRGALIITLDVNHPDIEDFISVKEDKTKVTGANISIKITDAFMEAVKEDGYYGLHHNLEGEYYCDREDFNLSEFKEADPEGLVWVEAKKLWDKIIHQIWSNAEPGLLFWDTIIDNSPSSDYPLHRAVSTNACSELPLPAYGSCLLGHINLWSFVAQPFTKCSSFDWILFREVVGKAMRLMDDIVNLEIEKVNGILDKIGNDPEEWSIKQVEFELWEKILKKLEDSRRVGLGATALGDCLAGLGMKYGSKEAIEFTAELNKTLATESYKSSIQLAKERGSFPSWDYELEKNNKFIRKIFKEIDFDEPFYERRNIACNTWAPTGSTSMLIRNSTSGIEPLFKVHYKRRRKVDADNPNKVFQDKSGDWWEEYEVFHPRFLEWYVKEANCEHCPELAIESLKEGLSEDVEKVVALSPYHGSTALEVDPLDKIKMIAAAQEWIDSAISNTLNFNELVKEEDVSEAFILAWKLGLKGCTGYRQGSRDGVLIDSNTSNDEIIQTNAIKRPKELKCDIFYPTINNEKWLVLVGIIKDRPYEVFAFKWGNLPDSILSIKEATGTLKRVKGSHYTLETKSVVIDNVIDLFKTPAEEILTRLISWALRHGAPIKFGVEQSIKSKGQFQDFMKVIFRQLKKYIKDGEKIKGNCPECGSELKYESGCESCAAECGYSKC